MVGTGLQVGVLALGFSKKATKATNNALNSRWTSSHLVSFFFCYQQLVSMAQLLLPLGEHVYRFEIHDGPAEKGLRGLTTINEHESSSHCQPPLIRSQEKTTAIGYWCLQLSTTTKNLELFEFDPTGMSPDFLRPFFNQTKYIRKKQKRRNDTRLRFKRSGVKSASGAPILATTTIWE